MNASRWITLGALLGAAAVTLGAFGAHGLKEALAAQQLHADDLAKRLEWFDTAVRYHFLHAIAIILAGLLAQQGATRGAAWTGGLFVVGLALFSGLLYVMTFTGLRWLGMIVPLGGLSFIAGWLSLAWQAQRQRT